MVTFSVVRLSAWQRLKAERHVKEVPSFTPKMDTIVHKYYAHTLKMLHVLLRQQLTTHHDLYTVVHDITKNGT